MGQLSQGTKTFCFVPLKLVFVHSPHQLEAVQQGGQTARVLTGDSGAESVMTNEFPLKDIADTIFKQVNQDFYSTDSKGNGMDGFRNGDLF